MKIKNLKFLHVRIEAAVLERARRYAEARGMKLSDFVRSTIIEKIGIEKK